jgi:hypothetical protein
MVKSQAPSKPPCIEDDVGNLSKASGIRAAGHCNADGLAVQQVVLSTMLHCVGKGRHSALQGHNHGTTGTARQYTMG